MLCGDGARRIHHYSFRLDNLLGKGATGEVYLGENTNNGEKVACKIIDMSKIDNEVTEYLLNNQKKALELLKHPNVIHTLDIFQERDYCYIFTEFCNQGTLFDGIQSKGIPRGNIGRLVEDEALMLFDQIVQGYRACLEKGIIHRDLKPANILMNSGVPLISDFGYCEIVGVPKPKIFYNVGSPSYMAPEAFVVNIYSQKSDVWSLGVVLYEMIVGHTFDGGGDIMECISNLGKHGVPYPDHVSPYCRYVINQCLNLDPARRINLKQLTQILKDRASLEHSEVVMMSLQQRQPEQPTAAQIPQMQRHVVQPQISYPQQQNVNLNRSIRQPIQQQQMVIQSQPQLPPQQLPQQNRQQLNMHNILPRQGQGQIVPNIGQPQQLQQQPPNSPFAHQINRNQRFISSGNLGDNTNRGVRQEQAQERVIERAATHHILSSTQMQIQQPINSSQEYLQLYEQTLHRNAQGRENLVVPRLMSHHAMLEDYNTNTARTIKSEADDFPQQRIERIDSETLRKAPSLESTHFRGKSQYTMPSSIQSSRGLPHKSERQLIIPTHERFISHQQQQPNFRPFSMQEGVMRPGTTATAVSPFSQQIPFPNQQSISKDKLVRSLLMTDVNKQEVPTFTQLPFQKSSPFFEQQIPKPQSHYLPGYHPFNRLPEQQSNYRTTVVHSPVSPIYPVSHPFEGPNNRQPPPLNHVPSFKKPAARIPSQQIPIQQAGTATEGAYQYHQLVHSPENRQNPLIRGPSIHRNGLQTQRVNRNTITEQQRVAAQPFNPQYRPVR